MSDSIRNVDVIVVGSGPAAAAAAKRTVDAGLETVILEKEKLPRHKVCSGILSPRGHRFLIENFGPLPREILYNPTSCRGVTFHFPSMLSMPMDFDHGPTPHLYRQNADYWAVTRSGAELMAETPFTGLEQNSGWIEVRAGLDRQPLIFRAKYVIGADGPNSPVRHAVYPDYAKQIPWFIVGQKFHEVIENPLDEHYFHFWFHPELGHYTWAHSREGRLIVGVGFPSGDNYDVRHQRVVDYLERKHGVKLEPGVECEIVTANFGPSLINRYIFGKGNVLITGQAAGFFNMIAEGMSCALHSGAIAGEAVVEATRGSRPVQDIYRAMIASEVRRCTDQWNPFKIAFGRPHEADFPAALKQHSIIDRIRIIFSLLAFIRIYHRFNWGFQILGQSIIRQLIGTYTSARWL